MTPEEARAFLASPSGVAAVEAGARAGFGTAFDFDAPEVRPETKQWYRDQAARVLSAVLVAGLLIPKEDA